MMENELEVFNNNLPVNTDDLVKFILIGREKLIAMRAEIRAIDKLFTATGVREQKINEAQQLAEMLLDAEIRVGEISKQLLKGSGGDRRSENFKITTDGNIETKEDQLRKLGLKHYERFEMLASYPEIVEQVKQDAKEKDELATRSEALKRITHFIKKENVHNAEEEYEENIKNVDDFDIDIYNTDQKFNIIYADPPWEYWEGGFKNQSLHYPTMSIDEIGALPISNIAADHCILFLWVTFPILRESFDIIEAWGFKYSTCGFVWLKKNKNTDSWFFGNGAWTRANTELCLIATKGTVTRLSASISQIVEAPISEHSQKPPIIRQLITDLVGGLPRIELFSRNTDDNGWFNWGNKI